MIRTTTATRCARSPSWLVGFGWTLWALAVLGLAVTVLLDQALRHADRPDLLVVTPYAVPPMLGALSVVTVGAVVASRRPRHPVSWLLLLFGLSLSAAGASQAYANYGVADAGAPAAGLVALYMPATIVTAIASCGLILLLTPTGALPSPGWRWWVGVMAATPVVVVLVVTLVSGPGGRPAVAVDSPLDLQQFEGAALVAYQVAFAVSITVFLMSAASLLMRFRRARGVERQQLRWVAFATVVVSLLSLANLAALALGAYALPGCSSPPRVASSVRRTRARG
jgi:hypothetical protein